MGLAQRSINPLQITCCQESRTLPLQSYKVKRFCRCRCRKYKYLVSQTDGVWFSKQSMLDITAKWIAHVCSPVYECTDYLYIFIKNRHNICHNTYSISKWISQNQSRICSGHIFYKNQKKVRGNILHKEDEAYFSTIIIIIITLCVCMYIYIYIHISELHLASNVKLPYTLQYNEFVRKCA